MRSTNVGLVVLSLMGLSVLAPASGASAQNEALRTHVGHLADAFTGTPNGQGLLPTARAEAEVVVRHATLAAADPANLEAMKLHAGHVLHAVDPTAMPSGPGLGYGLEAASEGVVRHASMLWNDESVPRAARMHAEHVTVSARNSVQRAEAIAGLAGRIREATTAEAAAELVRELRTQADALIPGVDANRDNGIGWRRGEGGLEVTRQHLAVLQRLAEDR